MNTLMPPRVWCVDPAGTAVSMSHTEALTHMRIPPQVSAAYDILTDDGMPPEKAATMALAAHRAWEKSGRTARDAEAMARHVVTLRKAVRR